MPHLGLNSSICDDTSLHCHLLVHYCTFIVVLPGLTLWNRTLVSRIAAGQQETWRHAKGSKVESRENTTSSHSCTHPWPLDKSAAILPAPQGRNSTPISISPFLSLPLVRSLHQDGEGAAHDAHSHAEGVQHRSEPADQTQHARAHHQLLPHPHLPAAHLHHRLAHVTPKDYNRPIARCA
ncbi:hypothetical protein Q8A67_019781 [Cirrhinus molitorella]|uniref:Uncharacterized protein n=1 Tax=Cirrhinus molitorella TaxID=172907 RepID=A0AA88PF38_9TELE|nr:hypothetical protein Q8A67_019781 [Cirrhinus molitorella]